jgi:oligoribonuclease NrnB/cAMP/cGMP phosphodiesterase (DHH superfamily)
MKCFYHNDADGRCAASVVAQYEFAKSNFSADAVPDKRDYFEVDYTKPLPDVVSKNEKVYIVDYSFKGNTLDQLQNILNKTSNVIWCDHHTSSINLLKSKTYLNYIPGIRQDGISGAALIYMHLHNVDFNSCPEYIKLVSDYDCWIYKYGDRTNYFKLGLESNDFDALDDVWLELNHEDNGCTETMSHPYLNSLIEKGKIIKEHIDKDNNYYLSHYGYESELSGYKCYVVNKKSNSWIFGNKINEYPFVVVYVFDGEQYVYSLFSTNPNIDCSKIAESLGGGGHKGAAGFVSDRLMVKKAS